MAKMIHFPLAGAITRNTQFLVVRRSSKVKQVSKARLPRLDPWRQIRPRKARTSRPGLRLSLAGGRLWAPTAWNPADLAAAIPQGRPNCRPGRADAARFRGRRPRRQRGRTGVRYRNTVRVFYNTGPHIRGIGSHFHGTGLHFRGVGSHIRGVGLRIRGIGLHIRGVGSHIRGVGLHIRGIGLQLCKIDGLTPRPGIQYRAFVNEIRNFFAK